MAVLILASASKIRAELLARAGLRFEVSPARIDEEALRRSLVSDGAGARDVADALAEQKARRVSGKHPQAMVLGCDQVLECEGRLFSKPETLEDARAQLRELRGQTHQLHTAAVLYLDGAPIWRHVNMPKLTMRDFSEAFLDEYLAQNWSDIRDCVGAYQVENVGIRLFDRIAGDYFSILGLPLLELLAFMARRGDIPG
ncbi:nucleoside triphosphate pyrophosphatase [Pararhodobacter sp. SW119]|uniref:Maf family protein n=1 Tax=Pararhodobacter sp. SW119 TaxID=2780075 RepID=UPI001AE034A1|nr:nucleoside triphosphate pyrophosphatase [Pararhodobacter sp. SW119]